MPDTGYFRQYRPLDQNEFIVVGCDTSSGLNDYCTAQFISKTKNDVPLIYHAKVSAPIMTDTLYPILERIYDKTGIKPTIAYERNNGGLFELDRLSVLNRSQKFNIFVMPQAGTTDNDLGRKLGWDTNSSTRPKMLSDLKDAIDKRVLHIYDKPTINEMFSFVKVQTSTQWKAQAEKNAHDDCFVKGTKILTDHGQVPIEQIKVGDLVMTRKGLQPVVMTRNKIKKVISRFGLRGTPDHPIITKRGEIPLNKVRANDIIYMWNEKLSIIEEKHIIDTQIQEEGSIEFTIGDMINGKILQSHFIDKFGLITLGKYLKGLLFTIKTTIHSITTFRTYKLLVGVNMQKDTWELQNVGNYRVILLKSRVIDFINHLKNGNERILNLLGQFTLKTEGNKKIGLSQFLKDGGKKIQKNSKLFLKKMGRNTDEEKVYNLQVANQHEYFAKNILVHNCIMALAIGYQLLLSENPKNDEEVWYARGHNKQVMTKWAI